MGQLLLVNSIEFFRSGWRWFLDGIIVFNYASTTPSGNGKKTHFSFLPSSYLNLVHICNSFRLLPIPGRGLSLENIIFLNSHPSSPFLSFYYESRRSSDRPPSKFTRLIIYMWNTRRRQNRRRRHSCRFRGFGIRLLRLLRISTVISNK